MEFIKWFVLIAMATFAVSALLGLIGAIILKTVATWYVNFKK